MSRKTTVRLGGEERTLRFSLGALSEFCDEYGIKLGDLMAEDSMERVVSQLPVSALQKAVYLALKSGGEDIEEDEVGRWVDLAGNAQEVFQAFFGLFAEMSLRDQMTGSVSGDTETDEDEAEAEAAA